MQRMGWALGVTLVLVFALVSLGWAETVVTTSGSVLQGTIEFGIPGVISIKTATGDIFTVQRANLKALRFPEKGIEVTVETFDGNVLIGEVGGIPEVLGLRSASGDVQSVKLTSIREIRFELPAAVIVPIVPTVPSIAGSAEALAAQVKELYETKRWAFTLGLDTGFQLGASTLNGFGLPVMTLGVNVLNLGGAIWRLYFPPSAQQIERAALEIATSTPGIQFDDLLAATTEEKTPLFNFYLHVGTSALVFPQVGTGGLFRLTPAFYFDAGLAFDFFWGVWPFLGFVFFF